MVASAVFILDIKGKVWNNNKVLISRNYRGDIPMSSIEKFMPLILQVEEEELTPSPILSSQDGIHFLYIRHNNLYLVAMTKKNSNAAMILLFLHKLCNVCWFNKVFSNYFKELEEESIRDNFVIIYELLDEMMDFGYPQTTETKILQEYWFLMRFITQESHKLEKQARPPMAVTNAVSWRSEGLKYRKNEVFLDVVESINLVVWQIWLGQCQWQCGPKRNFGCC